jgi:hypothetical protein
VGAAFDGVCGNWHGTYYQLVASLARHSLLIKGLPPAVYSHLARIHHYILMMAVYAITTAIRPRGYTGLVSPDVLACLSRTTCNCLAVCLPHDCFPHPPISRLFMSIRATNSSHLIPRSFTRTVTLHSLVPREAFDHSLIHSFTCPSHPIHSFIRTVTHIRSFPARHSSIHSSGLSPVHCIHACIHFSTNSSMPPIQSTFHPNPPGRRRIPGRRHLPKWLRGVVQHSRVGTLVRSWAKSDQG